MSVYTLSFYVYRIMSSVITQFYFFLFNLYMVLSQKKKFFFALLHQLEPPEHCWTEVVRIDILDLFLIIKSKHSSFQH